MQCAVCKVTIVEAEDVYEGHPLCADCAARAAAYEAQRAARIERLDNRAARVQAESKTALDRAKGMSSAIPFGQPILVGHHSEGRDRRYRERIDKTYRRGFELQTEAQRLEDAAEAARKNDSISSDDPLAVLKLEIKIADAEKTQARMKQANAAIRKCQDPTEAIPALIEMGYLESTAHKLTRPDFAGRIGFADYMLRNNNANIRRMKERLADLVALRAQELPATNATAGPEEVFPGLQVVRNAEENRLQLLFEDKPDAITRKVLKTGGWRWSPTHGAWQRFLNANSEVALTQVVEYLKSRA